MCSCIRPQKWRRVISLGKCWEKFLEKHTHNWYWLSFVRLFRHLYAHIIYFFLLKINSWLTMFLTANQTPTNFIDVIYLLFVLVLFLLFYSLKNICSHRSNRWILCMGFWLTSFFPYHDDAILLHTESL